MPPMRRARGRPIASRSICRQPPRPASCPISTRSAGTCWRGPWLFSSPRPPTPRARVPTPMQRVAIAAYGDEAHVEENRRLYAQKFDLADQIIGDRYGYRRPAGGFFLWLDVSALGGDEAVALRLWKEAGLRVVPGRYLARDQADGSNPGLGYIRVAMVQDQDTTAQALHRLVAVLG